MLITHELGVLLASNLQNHLPFMTQQLYWNLVVANPCNQASQCTPYIATMRYDGHNYACYESKKATYVIVT